MKKKNITVKEFQKIGAEWDKIYNNFKILADALLEKYDFISIPSEKSDKYNFHIQFNRPVKGLFREPKN